MDKRTETAMKVLAAGGYFRRQLEAAYMGEKFKYRLKDAEGRTVRGIGFATFSKLEARLKMRDCERSSSWPMEWELRNQHHC
jgi:hypothetical protein